MISYQSIHYHNTNSLLTVVPETPYLVSFINKFLNLISNFRVCRNQISNQFSLTRDPLIRYMNTNMEFKLITTNGV